jgi:hypothetical protein
MFAHLTGIVLQPHNFHFQIKYQNLYAVYSVLVTEENNDNGYNVNQSQVGYIYIYTLLEIGYNFNVFV